MLYGRHAELAAIDAQLAQADQGGGGAALLVGEAGIGKTALLTEAGQHAEERGMTVLRTTCIESEAKLPFGVLIDLITPLRDQLAELGSPVATALATMLEPTPGVFVPGDRLGVFAGVLELLRESAEQAPVLVCVDDAHWLDPSSAECLGYAARRLANTGVVMLLASRPPVRAEFAGPIPHYRLQGLNRDDARRLLAEKTTATLDSRQTAAILDAALGNPLALTELHRLLDTSGSVGFGSRVALEGSLGDAYRERIDALEPTERIALLVTAASSDRRAAPVVAAAASLGVSADVFESLEERGLLSFDSDRVEFAHPLLAGVTYRRATARERRQAHRLLADRTAGDSRAWHLAAAAVGFDDEAAQALELAAADATIRGAHETAADTMIRSAELSSDPTDRARRLLAAGLAAAMGGGYPRAVELLERAAEVDVPALRGAITHLDAMVALIGGTRAGPENRLRLTREAERVAADEPDLAAIMLADAALIAIVQGEMEVALGLAERAAAGLRIEAPPMVHCQVESILGATLALRGRAPEARQHLDRAGDLLAEVDPLSPAAQSILFAMVGRVCTGQESRLREEAHQKMSAASRSRSVGLLPYFQLQAADAACRLCELETALVDAEAAVEVARESHQRGPLSIALAVQSRVYATIGRTADARRAAREGIRVSIELGYKSPEVWNRAALGFTELGRHRTREAIEQLEQVAEMVEEVGLRDPLVVLWAPDLVEAYVAEGRHEDARRISAALDEQAAGAGIALASALAHRCRGLVASEDEFVDEFKRALELGDRAGLPLERARSLFALGVRLGGSGARKRARSVLQEALGAFETIGARSWAMRARHELRNVGAAHHRLAGGPGLTAQESRIAAAVADGATNREVAAQLIISPKTVEYHLGRIYRKLGISSRAQLAGLVASGRLPSTG